MRLQSRSMNILVRLLTIFLYDCTWSALQYPGWGRKVADREGSRKLACVWTRPLEGRPGCPSSRSPAGCASLLTLAQSAQPTVESSTTGSRSQASPGEPLTARSTLGLCCCCRAPGLICQLERWRAVILVACPAQTSSPDLQRTLSPGLA